MGSQPDIVQALVRVTTGAWPCPGTATVGGAGIPLFELRATPVSPASATVVAMAATLPREWRRRRPVGVAAIGPD